MVRIGGGSTKFVLSARWIVYTKSSNNCYTENTFYMKQAVCFFFHYFSFVHSSYHKFSLVFHIFSYFSGLLVVSGKKSDFRCPEEFGYYSHPTDCNLYYVCVFGGPLLGIIINKY